MFKVQFRKLFCCVAIGGWQIPSLSLHCKCNIRQLQLHQWICFPYMPDTWPGTSGSSSSSDLGQNSPAEDTVPRATSQGIGDLAWPGCFFLSVWQGLLLGFLWCRRMQVSFSYQSLLRKFILMRGRLFVYLRRLCSVQQCCSYSSPLPVRLVFKARGKLQQGTSCRGARRNNIKPLCQPHCKTLPESRKIFLLSFLSLDTKVPGSWRERDRCTDTIWQRFTFFFL